MKKNTAGGNVMKRWFDRDTLFRVFLVYEAAQGGEN